MDVWRCPSCGREVARRLARCPRCGSDMEGHRPTPGRAPDSATYELRPASRARPDWHPWQYVWVGLATSVVGALVVVLTRAEAWALVGALVAGFGGLLSTIGAIALGVRLGLTTWQRASGTVIQVSRRE